MASNFHQLSDWRDGGREARAGGGRVRLGGIGEAFALVRGLSWPLKFAIGVAVCLPCVAVRLVVFGFSPELPYFVFYPGVALAAVLGGSVAGAGGLLVSLLGGMLWGAPTLTVDSLLRCGALVFYAVAVSGLAEGMHRALWRLGEAEGSRAAAEKLLIATESIRLASADLIGAFTLDLVKNSVVDSCSARAIFGLPSQGRINPERLIALALPEDRPRIEAALAAAFNPSGDGAYEVEYRIHRENDNVLRWIAARGQVHFQAGRAVRMIGVCRDITDLRAAEQALRDSAQQIRRFVEHAPIEIAMLDRDMNYVAVSEPWLAKYGHGLKSLVGVNHYALNPDIPERWKTIHRRVAGGEFHSDESDEWLDAGGRSHWRRWAAFPWADSVGRIAGVIISVQDISAQKQAEAALRESEEKFRNAFADAAIGFVMAKAGGTIAEANAAYCRLTGYTPDELKTMRLIDLIHPEDRADVGHFASPNRKDEPPAYVIEHRYLRKDGEPIWVRESASMTQDPSGASQRIINLVEDVTERKRIEDSADRTVAQLIAVLDGAKDAIISIDINGVVQSINAAGERMFGYERDEVIGRNVSMLMPKAHSERHDSYIANYLKTGVGKIIGAGREVEGRRKGGELFPIELALQEAAVYNDLMFVGFVRDLSERRRIESRIDQLAAQRLTAIGGMAGALAHELNQPLAAIGVYLETARRMLLKLSDQRPAPIGDAIERALAQVARMGDIIGHLRAFVGHGEPDKTHQNLHALIKRVVSETIADERTGAAVSLALCAERDEVVMDPVQIGQVLSNLIRNAREAVGEAPGGRVVISTALEGENTIRCEVSDNGPGLDASVKERLFEPLTSTKATGLGVGLSISKSIIEAHYGRIWAEANALGGTAFSFTLPLSAHEGDE